MKGSQYLALFVRLFAIAIFIYVSTELIGIWSIVRSGEVNGVPISSIFMSLTLIIPFLIAVILWMFPSYIAGKIFRSEMDDEVAPLPPVEMLSVIISGVGVYYLYYAFIDTAYWSVFSHMAANSFEFHLDSASKIEIGITVLELVIALVLIFKSKTIARIIAKVAS